MCRFINADSVDVLDEDQNNVKKTTKNGSQTAGHRTTKNGSKRKTNDKHTRPRPGRQSEKKKMNPSWKRRR